MSRSRTRVLIRALFHPIRATVEKHIHAAAEPVSLAELASALDLEPRFARYHVRVLSSLGLVAVDDDDRVAAL